MVVAYSNQNLLHGFIGNSCPIVYFSEEKQEIHINTDSEYDENIHEYIPKDSSLKKLSYVSTDLWWYSICDLEVFKKRNPDVDTSNFEIVDIPKGKWELSHRYGIVYKENRSGYFCLCNFEEIIKMFE